MDHNIGATTQHKVVGHSTFNFEDSYEVRFDDLPGLLLLAGSHGCAYAPEVNLNGLLWQTGIKSHCGSLYGEVGLYIKFSHNNRSHCAAQITIQTEPSWGLLTTPERHFYPGREVFVILCDVQSIPYSLKVNVHFNIKVEQSESTVKVVTTALPQPTLQSELVTFLQQDKIFFDCHVNVDGTLFRAHKCVLAARSKVFTALLVGNASTINNNEIKVDNFLPIVVHLMLSFMYHDMVDPEELELYLCSLLELGAIYQVDSFLHYISQHLSQVINDDNMVNILLITQKYELNAIQKILIDIVSKDK